MKRGAQHPGRFHDETDKNGLNVIAELPGSDLASEIVLLGAHLDSWHSSAGATDNAAGVAVMMEAMRILKAVGAKPRRTIRVALWGGEEQGYWASRAYVREHLGDAASPKPEHQKLSAVLQHRQRHGTNPRRLDAGQRRDHADLRPVDRTASRVSA